MTFWKLHPIVGQIHINEVIIIFETSGRNVPLVLKFYSVEPYSLLQVTEVISTGDIGVTRVALSLPDQIEYDLEWYSGDILHYRHRIAMQDPRQYLFVSCDFLEADTNPSLWKKIEQEPCDSVLVHLGDQIYADAEFRMAEKSIKRGDFSRKKIFESYCQRYRQTWKRCHGALSNTSNIFLWDDHELVNNYCISEDHTDNESIIADVATSAYKMYQLSCHREMTIEGTFVRGRTTLITVERTSGKPSLEKVMSRLKESTTPKVLLCFASGPIPKPKGRFGKLYQSLTGEPEDDEGKFWSRNDLRELYSGICDWISKDPDVRDVVVVGGDLHFGTYGVVSKNIEGRTISFQVVVSSPVSNKPSFDREIAALGMSGVHEIGDGIKFATIESKALRCYCKVDVNENPCRVNMVWNKITSPGSRLNYYGQLVKMI
jgi:hypothetical protein